MVGIECFHVLLMRSFISVTILIWKLFVRWKSAVAGWRAIGIEADAFVK